MTGVRIVPAAHYTQLVGATVNKPNAVPQPGTAVAGNPFHTFVVPPAANTNDAFFMLEFNPAP